jgi:hypothetical protein
MLAKQCLIFMPAYKNYTFVDLTLLEADRSGRAV